MTDLNRRDVLATATLAASAAAVPALAQAAVQPVPAPATAAWDLAELYPSDAAFETARQAALAKLPSLAAYKGKLGTDAATLLAALQQQSDLGREASRLYTYASLKADEDVRLAPPQERQAQVIDLWTAFGQASAWIAPELLGLGKPRIDALVAANADLRTRFRVYLDNVLRQASHTLSAEGEMLLAGTAAALNGPQDIRGQLVASDIPWPTITLSTGAQVKLDDQAYTLNRDAPSRADRQLVFETFWKTYGQFQSSLGAAYTAKLKADVFEAKARRYPTSLASALSGGNVPEAVYRTLVAETNTGLPELHRYFELRRRLLKLPDMAYHDIYPPLVSLDRKFTLDEMRTLTMAATQPLGRGYTEPLGRATAARWMDPLPRPGKRSGAYMNPGAYDVHPYLLLNLGENYEGLSTYAHEWGHAMHTLLANAAQPYETAGYPIFLAEVASTANEQLLVAYMLERAKTREEKLFYLGQQLEGMRGTFFRQAMFAEFELKTHDMAEAGEGLSGERYTELYLDLLKRYHGPGVAMNPVYAAEWAYVPHFYTSFYVYQYATSIAAATYFAQAILAGGVAERDRYLTVLKAGGSDYPVDVLKRAGLDMAGPAPYRALVATFKRTLDEAEKLVG